MNGYIGGEELQGAREEVARWAQTCEPQNTAGKASAARMFDIIEGMADHTEATGDAYTLVGGKIEEQVLLDFGAADLVKQVGANIRSQAEPIREAKAQIEQMHHDRFAHMRSEDERAGSWDWERNQADQLA